MLLQKERITSVKYWSIISLFWLVATIFDRVWWNFYTKGIPAWDQADYLNSALDHGRALGFLKGGEWQGLESLIDLSPKIPPFASIVNGLLMALTGELPVNASWSLSLWHAFLIFSVAGWCLLISGQRLGYISSFILIFSPALLDLRTNYVLEMPLISVTTFSLWQLGAWLDFKKGGKFKLLFLAFFASSLAILVKQSALLILFPALILSVVIASKRSQIKPIQIFIGFLILFLMIFPWLSHNWILTIGGTKRAVIESAINEGDPSILTFDNWIWYFKLLPKQIGLNSFILGISGYLLSYFNHKKSENFFKDINKFQFKWLVFNLFSCWFLTTLVPNKDPRYIASVLPLLVIFVSLGCAQLYLFMLNIIKDKNYLVLNLFLFFIPFSVLYQVIDKFDLNKLTANNYNPLQNIINEINYLNINNDKKTLIVIPSTSDLNQHNTSFFGRINYANIVGRQLGKYEKELSPMMTNSSLILLAEGDQGSVRPISSVFDNAVRNSDYFENIKYFPRGNGNSYSLWRRTDLAPPPFDFSETFQVLATNLSLGPKAIEDVFDEIGIHHMIDGHLEYQDRVKEKAQKILINNPTNINARWSLTLLAILQNRPKEADKHLAILENLEVDNPWPSVYRSMINLIDLKPWKSYTISKQANKKFNNKTLIALSDISGFLSGRFWLYSQARYSFNLAIKDIEDQLK